MPATQTKLSTAETVRRWVNAAPDDSVLDVRDVPGGPSNAVRVALSSLARDPRWPVWSVRHNLYWKGHASQTYWADWPHGGPVDWGQAALHAGGPGSGWAGFSAAKIFGWTHQVLIAPAIAVVGRPPRGFDGEVTICSRSNKKRKALNTVEVSLIEAIVGFEASGAYQIEYKYGHSHYCMWDTEDTHPEEDCLWGWGDALEHLATKLLRSPFRWGEISPERLATAALGERIGGQLSRQRIIETAETVARALQASAATAQD